MAKVLTGISGNLISAASAGFAPTNSADVSAIASAYQVVSATATQLYAGTAYVTSVNGAPLSASRAGQAANASLASSAYYDGTGRLISSLPDSAAVSAIASAYAESAASGKQDTLTFAYNAGSAISSINGSALAGQGGGGGGGGGSVVSPSGTIIVTDGTAIDASDSAVFVTGGYETSTAVQPSTRYMYDSPHTILSGMNISGADGIHFLWEQREQMGEYVQYSVSAFSGDEDADFISSQDKYVYDYETETGTVYPLDPSWKIARIDTCRLDGWTTFDLPTGSSILFEANLPLGSAVKPLQSRLQYGYDGAGHISSIEGSGVGGVVSSTGTTSGYLTRVNGKRIIGAPSAMAYYANTGFDTSFSAELGSISVATYTSTANVPLPNPVNAIYFSGFTGGRTTGRISAKMMDGTTWSSNIRTMGQTLFTASAEMSAARLIMSSTKYEYFYPRYSAGTYHASGDVVFPLPKASDYVPKSSYNVAFGTGVMATDTALAAGSGTKAASHSVAIGQTCSASAESVAFGFNTTANLASFAAGNSNSAAQSSMAVGYSNKASSYSISIGSYNSAYDYTVAMGEGNSGSSASLAAGMNCRAFAYAGAIGSLASATQGSFSNGIEVSAYWCSLAVGSATTATHRSLAAGTSASAFQRSMAQGVQCYASGDSFAQGGYVSASSNSFAQGYKLTAYNTAAAFGNYNLSGDGSGSSGAAFVIGDGTADEARHDLMVVTKNGEITMYSGTADTAGTGILSSIRALSASVSGVTALLDAI